MEIGKCRNTNVEDKLDYNKKRYLIISTGANSGYLHLSVFEFSVCKVPKTN